MANFHNELDRINAKYSSNEVAKEAIAEMSKCFYEFLYDFIKKANEAKNNNISLS